MLKVAVISGENSRDKDASLKRLSIALINLSAYSNLWVISPLNRGIETEAAKLTLSLSGTRLECAIPFEEQAALWSEEERDLYFSVIEKADRETLITTKWQENSELFCYDYLVNEADIILLGTPPNDEIEELVTGSGKRIIKI